jgi:hypothetical protein
VIAPLLSKGYRRITYCTKTEAQFYCSIHVTPFKKLSGQMHPIAALEKNAIYFLLQAAKRRPAAEILSGYLLK